MAAVTHEEQMVAYGEAVKSGLYAKKSGLIGKYDNVRRYWEDEITRQFLRPHLHKLIERCRQQMRRLRIMDLGCGGADGYELLMGVRQRDADLEQVEVDLISPEILGVYKGVDLSGDLLRQARSIYGDDPKMVFEQADFTMGLPISKDEKPYDLYFSSYGTCSHHNDDETLVALLADIARRTKKYSVIICDWLGRYSYEWQTLWTNDVSENRNMDYVVSYIYDAEEREARREELQHLWLRLMSRQEVDLIVKEASKKAEVEIKSLVFFDRSVLTGRHMDTAEHNAHAQPLRQAVNSLHEVNLRTDLTDLVFDYVPKPGFDLLNDYFEHLQLCWNALVRYAAELLTTYDEERRVFQGSPPSIPGSYPPALCEMMERMKLVVEGVGWLGLGLPRENIIEPQLGYALRYLVTNLQRGQGCAHGLVGIFEVDKER
ncbi:MAG TPA: class I SAM-dependent methyltransferase [Candidatus Hydrogenedentes bacterium]|nr:class I SAM-dependent methyltransferase [Candidatus Hydrogenedentota bacterium]